MRFYTQQHQHYCGVDLHTRTMYLCILSSPYSRTVGRHYPVVRKCEKLEDLGARQISDRPTDTFRPRETAPSRGSGRFIPRRIQR